MKTGIILYCHNEEEKINPYAFTEFLKIEDKYHLCFVNNASSDETLTLLKKIQRENPNQVSIVDIKKKNQNIIAIRAGTRYLGNLPEIINIGFLDIELDKALTKINLLEEIQKLEIQDIDRDNFGRNFLKRSISGIIKSILLFIIIK
ncbi:hypothetical protein SAMN05216480_101198 [Pustulibacterium marinum]|uniref:Glycosyl transferase family 2 n=1 Tax=Pustulibacterium marinum TaxID=1224947 RepID=A0A1I7EUA6_9FLAO|nr:hypothetical protein [Pustulibacterium marinum]SFU27516.1 hypothetical protein SAMN05216480_101198 [Pustulibacterium marinum]